MLRSRNDIANRRRDTVKDDEINRAYLKVFHIYPTWRAGLNLFPHGSQFLRLLQIKHMKVLKVLAFFRYDGGQHYSTVYSQFRHTAKNLDRGETISDM